jgi:hypothetical protein
MGSLESAADSWKEMNESGSLWLVQARWMAGTVAVMVDSHNDIEP